MRLSIIRKPRRALLSTFLTAGVLLGGPLATVNTAHAAVACRSDPVLVVNGATVDVVSTLATSATNIQELDYVVTVPAGSLLGQTTLTVGLGFPEKVSYVFSAAQPWGTLTVAASVRTPVGVAPFQTAVTATSPLSLLTGATTARGLSTAAVVLHVGHLVML